jgi:hypothetical protein
MCIIGHTKDKKGVYRGWRIQPTDTNRGREMTDRKITGGDIDSYCTRCKLDLEHIILAMVGGAVVKVQCKTCGSIHRLKGMPAVRPESSRKEGAAAKTFASCRVLWEAGLREASGPELPYDMERSYRDGDVVVHSIFGKGVVQKTFFKKCTVLFKDKERMLVTSNT